MDHGIYPLKNAHQRVSSDDNYNGSAGPKVEVDSFMDRDEREMAILGKKQQLKVGRRNLEKVYNGSRFSHVNSGISAS